MSLQHISLHTTNKSLALTNPNDKATGPNDVATSPSSQATSPHIKETDMCLRTYVHPLMHYYLGMLAGHQQKQSSNESWTSRNQQRRTFCTGQEMRQHGLKIVPGLY